MMSPRGIIACGLLALLFSHAGCQAEAVNDVPEDLLGTWTTGAPRYDDRYLKFTSDSVIVGTGEYTSDTYIVVDIKKETEKFRTLYTVSYKKPGGANYKLTFYYDADDGGLLTFKHQEHLIWERERG